MLLKSDPYLCLSQIALYAPKHDIKFLAVQYSKTEIAEEKIGFVCALTNLWQNF